MSRKHGRVPIYFHKWLFPQRPCQQNLFIQMLIRAFHDNQKPFLFSDLMVKATKSENKKGLFNVREGSDYPTAWLT